MRAASLPARRSGARWSVLTVEGDAVQLHTVIDQPEAQLFSDLLLQLFQFRIDELDDIAGFDVDQMVVMRFRRRFVTSAAIAEVGGVFAQNAADVNDWRSPLDAGQLPIVRGHRSSMDDVRRQQVIMELMCNLEYPLSGNREYFTAAISRLLPLVDDGLVTLTDDRITVTPTGRYFLRNICMAFDAYLGEAPAPGMYSRSI